MLLRSIFLLLAALAGYCADSGLGPLPAGASVFSGGAVPLTTQIAYSNGTTLQGDSAFVRSALVLTADPNTDNTFTTGYGKMGLATSGTSTAFYIAQASNYNSTDYLAQQLSTGTSTFNAKTTWRMAVGGTTKGTLISSSFTLASGVTAVHSDTTDGTSGTAGSINTLGGIGVTKAVWVGTNLTVANGLYAQTITDALTNTAATVLTLNHATSGTAAAGFGMTTLYNLVDDGGTNRNAASTLVSWTIATAAGFTSQMQFRTVSAAGGLALALTVGSGGVTIPSTGVLVASSVTDGTSGSAGAINTLGGIGVTKAVWVGTNVTLANGLYAQTVDDAATATPTAMLTMSHTSTGTAAAGFGTQIKYNLEDDGGTNRSAASILANWTTAVSASRTSSLQLQTSSDAGSVLTAVTVQYPAAAGNLPSILTNGASTITGGVTDGYNSSIRITPTYDAATAQTVTRHNYIDINQVLFTGAGPAAATDAAVFRFNAATGTHKALASNGAVASVFTANAGPTGAQTAIQGWIKWNVNGTLRYTPFWAQEVFGGEWRENAGARINRYPTRFLASQASRPYDRSNVMDME